MIFGIQGGRGSFNEQALQQYTHEHEIFAYETTYLYTTHAVMESLMQGTIDF